MSAPKAELQSTATTWSRIFPACRSGGLPAFAVNYKGAEWYFVTASNAAKFRLSPDAYIPKYGGFCAYGVANGYLVKSDPLSWSIHQGKLYLNFNDILRVKWLTGRAEYLSLSEKYWPKLIG